MRVETSVIAAETASVGRCLSLPFQTHFRRSTKPFPTASKGRLRPVFRPAVEPARGGAAQATP
jgi:hypothetical protein